MSDLFIPIRLERLPEGPILATSDALPGLVAEALEIAQDVARKMIESYRERGEALPAGIVPEPPDRLFVPVTA